MEYTAMSPSVSYNRKESTSFIRIPFHHYDMAILLPVIFLVGIGVVMVYSASSAIALKKLGDGCYFLKKQAVFSIAGIGLLVFFRHVSLKWLESLTYHFLFAAFLMLIAIYFPWFGIKAGGATRWLSIGGISFQPVELVRCAIIFYLAYSISRKQDDIHIFTAGFLPHALVTSIFALLILFQPDFGSVVIIVILTSIMMFVGGVPFKQLFVVLSMFAPVIYLFMISRQYRMERLLSYWNPWQYATDSGYQIVHSLMAFGSGGLFGVGIAQGKQKLFYLPEPHTDFIFSVIGEELGLAGVGGILILFGLILYKGIRIAMETQDLFASLLALGITVSFGLQVCINIGVTLALLPTKGLTLPFLSYGGTSLLVNMACIGILLNIGALRHEAKKVS